jgi:hypothetical protein
MDFKKYPHIVGEEAPQSESKSLALDVIRAKFEDLSNMLTVYITEVALFDNKKQVLEQKEEQLKEFKQELDTTEEKLYRKADALDKEKEYITQENKALKEREMKLNRQKNYAEEIEKGKVEWERVKQEVLRKEYDVDAKLKRRQQDIEDKELLARKISETDEQRKRLLDLREKRIEEIEKQRRIDAAI